MMVKKDVKKDVKRTSRNRFWMLAAVLVMLMAMTGCQKKYEPIDVPTLEEIGGELAEEDGAIAVTNPVEEQESGSTDGTAGAELSSHEAAVTTETAPAFTAVDETVYVTGNEVNLRKSAGPSGEVVTQLKKGVSLKRTGYSDTWSKVTYEGQECYISSQFLSTTEPETEPETAAPSADVPSADGNKSGRLIAIDPGHQAKGNSEKEPIGPGSSTKKAKVASGTQGNSTGIPEYKLTLAVSLKLKDELISRGYQVYMIRETNEVNISNAERAEMANNSGADIFVRVHANSLSDTSVHGALSMCMTSKNPYNANLYKKSSALSKLVTNGICDRTGFKNRGVQEVDNMSGINWCKIPVTIVEMGFMSNTEEDQKMATEEYRDKIAKGIADGIDAYYAAGN